MIPADAPANMTRLIAEAQRSSTTVNACWLRFGFMAGWLGGSNTLVREDGADTAAARPFAPLPLNAHSHLHRLLTCQRWARYSGRARHRTRAGHANIARVDQRLDADRLCNPGEVRRGDFCL